MTPLDAPTARLRGELSSVPTPGEIRCLRAYIETGSARDAGRLIGLSEHTVNKALERLRRRARVKLTAQAVFVFRDYLDHAA